MSKAEIFICKRHSLGTNQGDFSIYFLFSVANFPVVLVDARNTHVSVFPGAKYKEVVFFLHSSELG